MSEQSPPATATEPGDQPDPTAPPTGDPKPTETVEFWKAKAREQESRAKTNAEKAKQFDALTEAQKTEQQKLTDAAAAEKARADVAESELTKFRVAATKGLAATDVQFLTGTTEAEIAASADALLTRLGSAAPKPPSFDGGTRTPTATKSDMNSLIRTAAGYGSA